MKTCIIIAIVLTCTNCYCQPDIPHNALFLKVKKSISVYSIPDVDDTRIIDNMNDGSTCLGSSIVLGKTKFGNIPFWHICYGTKTGYIKDFIDDLDYNFDRRTDFELLGYDSVKANENHHSICIYSSAKAYEDQKIKNEYNKILKAQSDIKEEARKKLLVKQLKEELGIEYFDYWYPKYSSSATIKFAVTNYSKNPIKYIYFTVVAFDAVGGQLNSMTRNSVKLKGIGPIQTLHTGEYVFDNAFWSNVIDNMRISRIDIEYMNGIKKVITKTTDIAGVNSDYSK